MTQIKMLSNKCKNTADEKFRAGEAFKNNDTGNATSFISLYKNR